LDGVEVDDWSAAAAVAVAAVMATVAASASVDGVGLAVWLSVFAISTRCCRRFSSNSRNCAKKPGLGYTQRTTKKRRKQTVSIRLESSFPCPCLESHVALFVVCLTLMVGLHCLMCLNARSSDHRCECIR